MSEPPIDLVFLRLQTGGDAALEADLLSLFLHQADELEAMIAGLGILEQGHLPATLHRIKGSARAIGARPLATAIEQAEESLSGTGATKEIMTALQALRLTLTDACSFAASRLLSNGGGGLAKPPESR